MVQYISPSRYYSGEDLFLDNHPPIRILHMDHSIEYPSHSHDFTEMAIVYSGSAIHHIGSDTHKVVANDVLLIPKGFTHSYSEVDDFSYVNVLFDSENLFKSVLHRHFFSLLHEFNNPQEFYKYKLSSYEIKEALSIVNRIDREFYRNMEISRIVSVSYFIQLLSMLYEASSVSFPAEVSSKLRIQSIIDSIDNNVSENYTIESLAAKAMTSPRNFSRLFKCLTGKSPSIYIKEKRIEKACALLTGTDMTITQIALLVGFDDPNYFSHTFRVLKGVSPRGFRSES